MLPAFGLAIALLLICLTMDAKQPEQEPSSVPEVKAGERYFFVAAGMDLSEQGTLAEVISVNEDWIKVKFLALVGAQRVGWINLNQVGAVKNLRNEEEEAIRKHQSEEKASQADE